MNLEYTEKDKQVIKLSYDLFLKGLNEDEICCLFNGGTICNVVSEKTVHLLEEISEVIELDDDLLIDIDSIEKTLKSDERNNIVTKLNTIKEKINKDTLIEKVNKLIDIINKIEELNENIENLRPIEIKHGKKIIDNHIKTSNEFIIKEHEAIIKPEIWEKVRNKMKGENYGK